jgi:hypothetical protein
MNSYIRIVATPCSLGTGFVSGILHKGDTDDDEDDDDNNNNNKFFGTLRKC